MFDHVDDKLTRDVLTLAATDGASVDYALDFANQCLQADQHNEEVSFEVYDMRAMHLENAHSLWVNQKDLGKTVVSLQSFWNV
jgi:hypothetical protein